MRKLRVMKTCRSACPAMTPMLLMWRGRYVDMIVTEGVIDTFRTRSLVNSTIRRFLEDKQFLEARVQRARGSCSLCVPRPQDPSHLVPAAMFYVPQMLQAAAVASQYAQCAGHHRRA